MMQKASINWYPDFVLGTFNPEEGDIAAGLQDVCNPKGILLEEDGQANSMVYQGKDFVCILTFDTGYGISNVAVHSKEVWEEINSRTK